MFKFSKKNILRKDSCILLFVGVIFNMIDALAQFKIGETNMKKMSILLAAFAVVLIAGCTTAVPRGGIYSEMTLPALATGNKALTKTTGLKIGTSTCESILGMIATGDASIEAACQKGKITKIYHVDWKVVSEIPLGIKTVYTTTVYGE